MLFNDRSCDSHASGISGSKVWGGKVLMTPKVLRISSPESSTTPQHRSSPEGHCIHLNENKQLRKPSWQEKQKSNKYFIHTHARPNWRISLWWFHHRNMFEKKRAMCACCFQWYKFSGRRLKMGLGTNARCRQEKQQLQNLPALFGISWSFFFACLQGPQCLDTCLAHP